MVSLEKPSAVELSTWIGVTGCGRPISRSKVRIRTASWPLMQVDSILASAAEHIMLDMMQEMEWMGPLRRGVVVGGLDMSGKMLPRKYCPPARLQAKGTELTYTNTLWLLNYTATHPDATISYTASDMILHIHSDASYLSEPCARSRAGGHYFLGNIFPDMSKPPTTCPLLNGPIHSISCIMSNMMCSADEAEIESTCINGQEAVPICTLLLEIGRPQPVTPIRTA